MAQKQGNLISFIFVVHLFNVAHYPVDILFLQSIHCIRTAPTYLFIWFHFKNNFKKIV